MIVDFHSHILAKIDDGSKSVEESVNLLCEEVKQGVDTIVLTPHFYAQKMSIDSFLNRREASEKSLFEIVAKNEKINHIKHTVGAEVFYFSGIGKARDLKKLCLRDSDVILLEMPFEQWTEAIYRDVKEIIRRQRLRVVLVHIERYIEFQNDLTVWNKILDLPVVIQVNGGSLIKCLDNQEKGIELNQEKPNGGFFSKLFGGSKNSNDRRNISGHVPEKYKIEFYQKLLDKKGVFILGSDTHNMDRRKPNVGFARTMIEKDSRFGSELLKKIDKASALLL